LLTKTEKNMLLKICQKGNNIFNVQINNLEDLEQNKTKLMHIIYYVYYLNFDDTIELKTLEKKLWELYRNLTGLYHQHELFCNWEQLDDAELNKKIKEMSLDQNYSNLYFADINCYGKKYFHYCAEILRLRGYPKIQDVIPELLMWMQDINWPGSYEIFQLLCTIPKHVFLPHFKEILERAYLGHDLTWLSWLYLFLEPFQISQEEIQNENLFNILIKCGNDEKCL